MSVEHPANLSPSVDSADALVPVPEAGAGACARCGLALTRLGAHGECLHCALSLALRSEVDPNGTDELSAGVATSEAAGRVWRYGHFGLLRDSDGHALELGSGAMATTYRAVDTVLGTPVALKVISRNVAGQPAARARFLREARAAARLHHPNVASVTFHGEQDGECFYAMELVEGETLGERVRRSGPFTSGQTLEIGLQVARALAAAEAVGVVHRDLKPSNLMLVGVPGSETPLHVKVIDWGLAKAVSADDALLGADHTREGGFVGTPAFASPEQFGGRDGQGAERERIDVRSDIYSLGVTLWYLLCGKAPFVGDTLDAIHARQRLALPLTQLRAARMPAALADVLKTMLAFDPAERPQSARELLDLLLRCQKHFVQHSPERLRRRRWRLAGVVVLLLACGLSVMRWRWRLTAAMQAKTPEKLSLAVLPFDNLSPDLADAFLADSVSDEIAGDLSRVAALRVIGINRADGNAQSRRDLVQIARELRVGYLLCGNVQRDASRVRVRVRLVDANDPTYSWTRQYDRRYDDVFTVQGEAAREVAMRLKLPLSLEEKAAVDKPPTRDLHAYELYQRARSERKLHSESSLDVRTKAIRRLGWLEEAVALDPDFALAYCDLAGACDDLYRTRRYADAREPIRDVRAQAEAALLKARRLQPDAGEVHFAQANHFFDTNGDLEQTRLEAELAHRALPNNASVTHLLSLVLRAQGQVEDAARLLEEAIVLEPWNTHHLEQSIQYYRQLRRYNDFARATTALAANLPPAAAKEGPLVRAEGWLEETADLTTLRSALTGYSAENRSEQINREVLSMTLALCAHDADSVDRLASESIQRGGFVEFGFVYPLAWYQGLAARMRGDQPRARAAFSSARVEVEKLLLGSPADRAALSLLAMIDAGLGRAEDAVREAQSARQIPALDGTYFNEATIASNLAVVYAWTGQPDRALDELEQWAGRAAPLCTPMRNTYGDFRLNPIWDSLRDNPRFAALTARLAPKPNLPAH